MSQPDVERALGRLLTDEQFRRAFAADPGAALRRAGLALSTRELAALTALPVRVLARLGARVDDRIRHLAIPIAKELRQ